MRVSDILERAAARTTVYISTLETAALGSATRRPSREPDAVIIRGVRLLLDELVDLRFFEADRRQALRESLQAGKPFPHLVVEGLFNPRLLDLVAEEFEVLPGTEWSDVKSHYESTRRSVLGARLGPASQLYFDVVNSGWFTEWVSSVTAVPYLLPDPKLFGGGLHESRPGATFAVHRDFNLHRHLGLKNEMVFITYLNKGWQREWGASLELWDAERKQAVTSVLPEFGHSILLPHSQVSYHGHPDPMQTPDGRPRRSVAAYYYTSPDAGKMREDQVSSVFLKIRRFDKIKRVAQMVAPPVLWSAARKIAKR
ncbi:MAG: 2OG-Fe(II) oxygenase [Comamonadaceae bacterium]|nr:MAG: 2OG-Fe(II) oxygenase [Comamonadaceae bacterium]